MTEQTLTPVLGLNNTSVDKILEEARRAHERYLIKQQCLRETLMRKYIYIYYC